MTRHLMFLICSFFLLLSLELQAAPRKFRVGTSLALTGPASEYGVAFRNGIEIAREEKPLMFEPLEFLYEDHKVEAKTAVTVLQNLLDVKKVDLILNWSVPTTAAMAPIIERKQVPLITSSVDASATVGKRYIIRTINHTEQLSKVLLEHLRKQGYKKLAIVMDEDPYFNQLLKGLRDNLKSGESIDIAGVFQLSDNDFKAQIARLRGQRYDALGIYLIPGQISLFYKQAAALGLSLPTFGTDIFESKTEIVNAEGHMSGAVYSNIDIPDSFISSYRAKFGNDNQVSYAYNAYKIAILLAEALADLEPGISSEQILYAVEKTAKTKREYTFQDTEDGGRFLEFPVVIKKIKGNEIVVAR